MPAKPEPKPTWRPKPGTTWRSKLEAGKGKKPPKVKDFDKHLVAW